MGLFFAYILKSTICLTLFYLFYRLLLSKDTFHRFNRIALLSLILLSVVIPFINISIPKATVIQYPIINLEQFLLITEQPVRESAQISGWQILIVLYIAGIVFFAARLIHSAWTIVRLIRSGEKISLEDNISLIVVDHNIVPFSWMKYIVISRTDWEDNKNSIIMHETAHIRYCHSWDVFISELCTAFHWFNPAAWLLKQELQNIHEYEADESVINQGIDAKKYQLLLIKKAVGTKCFNSMANSFNHSKLKKRITMMLKSKSNAWARLKYVYVLPLAAITTIAFARPEISRELDKISSTKISELPLIKEVLQEKNELLALEAGIQQNIAKDSQQKRKSVDAIIKEHLQQIHTDFRDQKEIEKASIQEAINKAQVEIDVLGEPEKFTQEIKMGEEITIREPQEIEKSIKESGSRLEKYMEEKEKIWRTSVTASLAATGNVFVIIDGNKASSEEFNKLKPEQITNLRYDMNKENSKKYGEGMEGVIFVETNKE